MKSATKSEAQAFFPATQFYTFKTNRKEVSRLPKTSDHIQKMAPLVRYHDISHFWNYCISEPSPSRGQKIQQFLGK